MRAGFLVVAIASIAAARPFERRQASSTVAPLPVTGTPPTTNSASSASIASSSSSAAPSSSAAAAANSTSASATSSAAAAPSASANATTQFIAAVRARNAYAFADLLGNNTAIVDSLIPMIGANQSPLTVVLPADEALASVPSSTVSNSTRLAQLITNHVIPGNVTAASIPAVGVYPNALTSYRGRQQYVVFNRNATTGTTQLGGIDNGTILANSTYQNVLFKLSTGLVQLPQNASATLANNSQVSTLYSLLGSIPNVTQQVDQAQAITIFAPINSGLSGLAANAGSLNAQTIQQVIQNHVLQQTLYSPNISSSTQVQNANGQPVTFATNATGTFVTSGGATAQIVTPNLQLYNGVVHLINGVLFAQNSTSANSTAAGGASASAVSPSSTAASSSALSSVTSRASSVASSTAAPTTSA